MLQDKVWLALETALRQHNDVQKCCAPTLRSHCCKLLHSSFIQLCCPALCRAPANNQMMNAQPAESAVDEELLDLEAQVTTCQMACSNFLQL